MNANVRSSLIAAAISVPFSIVVGLIFVYGGSGTALFALAMAAIAFVGTFVITTLISNRR